jgi:carboxymethylenebutenolidase
VPPDAEDVLAGACPIVGSYGGRDRALRGHAARLDHALSALGIDHDVKEYPQAGHSFLNRHHGPFAAIEKVLGMGFQGPAAGDAWGRIMAFFDTHVRGEAAAAGD